MNEIGHTGQVEAAAARQGDKEAVPAKLKPRRNKGGNGKKSIAGNIAELCQAVGISAPTFNNWKDHIEAPPKHWKGYDIEAWKAFAKAKGIQTAFVRMDKEGLKNKLTECDIELRQIEIEKQRGKLVDKGEATQALLELANMFRLQVEGLPAAFDCFRNQEITRQAEKVKADILSGLQAKLKGQG